MAPPRSLSKRSKALLISSTYSTVQYSLAKSWGLKLISLKYGYIKNDVKNKNYFLDSVSAV